MAASTRRRAVSPPARGFDAAAWRVHDRRRLRGAGSGGLGSALGFDSGASQVRSPQADSTLALVAGTLTAGGFDFGAALGAHRRRWRRHAVAPASTGWRCHDRRRRTGASGAGTLTTGGVRLAAAGAGNVARADAARSARRSCAGAASRREQLPPRRQHEPRHDQKRADEDADELQRGARGARLVRLVAECRQHGVRVSGAPWVRHRPRARARVATRRGFGSLMTGNPLVRCPGVRTSATCSAATRALINRLAYSR